MPMMPPDADLKKHLANRRSLAEARAAYLASPRDHQAQQSDICDLEEVRKEFAPHPTDQMIVTGDTVWRQFVALVLTSKRPWRR